MIIKGELDEYEVLFKQNGYGSSCTVYIYKGPLVRKSFFGLIKTKVPPVYTTKADISGVSAYDANRMLPNELKHWFTKAVQEYERFHKAWNQ